MDKNDVIKFYYDEANKYDIRYKLVFSRGKKTLGYADLGIKEIGISKWHIEGSSTDSVKDTILHEIAHAIAYEKYGEQGHGNLWKKVCLEIGANPERLKGNAFNIQKPPSKYTLTCPECGKVYTRHRMVKHLSYLCSICVGKPKLNIKKNW